MSGFVECQQKLLDDAKRGEFLTFDDILDAASTFSLSASEIDRLCDNLQSQGVLLFESEPKLIANEVDTFSDYSRTDYDSIFGEVITLSDTLSPLIDIVRNVPPPQFGEVQSLVEQLWYENTYARERLVLSHLRIAIKIALSIAKQYSYAIEDSISASFIGLMEAVEHFDPNGFSTFQSYASMWIQQNIHRYCNPIWMLYYCPVHIKEKMYPVLLRYNQNNGMCIYDEEYDSDGVHAIAEEFGFSDDQVERYLRFAYYQLNCRFELDDLIDCESKNLLSNKVLSNSTIEDYTSQDKSPFEMVSERVLKSTIMNLLDTFSNREKEIIILRFGLNDGVPRTLEDVGQVFGITRERVRQIENKCLRRLRHPSRSKKIKEFYY